MGPNTNTEGVMWFERWHEYTVDINYVDSKLLFEGRIVWISLRNVKCGTFVLSADRCT